MTDTTPHQILYLKPVSELSQEEHKRPKIKLIELTFILKLFIFCLLLQYLGRSWSRRSTGLVMVSKKVKLAS